MAARTKQAAAARAHGDRRLAADITALRKPTQAAWVVNQLAREQADDLAALLDLGSDLREAQAQMSGPELRRLSTQRQRTLTGLLRAADRVAERNDQHLSE